MSEMNVLSPLGFEWNLEDFFGNLRRKKKTKKNSKHTSSNNKLLLIVFNYLIL